MTLILALITSFALSWLPATTSDGALFTQVCQCDRARFCPDPEYMTTILDYEEAVGLPQSYRGLTLAAMCMESGFSSKARGDHKFHPRRKAKAHGLLQMWPWWERKYGDIRSSEYEAPKRFLEAIAEAVPAAEKACGVKGDKAWLIAWVRVTRGRIGKCLNHHQMNGTLTIAQWRRCQRCDEWDEGGHYRRWSRWQYGILRDQKAP